MNHALTVSQLQQDVVAVLEGVQEGHTYTLIDDGRLVATITSHRSRRSVKSADLQEILKQLGPDPALAADLRRLREDPDLVDP